jgi:hypothetical protein
MMADQNYIGPELFHKEVSDLLERLNRIKVMLWAGDATAARSELEQVGRDHEQLIASALKVKSDVYIKNKSAKQPAVLRISQQRSKGWKKDYLIKAEQAKNTILAGNTEAGLFVLSPIASLITKLDKRVAKETKQDEVFAHITSRLPQKVEGSEYDDDKGNIPERSRGEEAASASSIIHQASGFRLNISARDDGRWEVRGYQLHPPSLETAQLFENLKALPNTSVEQIGGPDSDSWPQRIRGYSAVCHFDLTFFDPGRFIFNIVVRQDDKVEEWGEGIMTAIAKSQGNKSSDPNSTLPLKGGGGDDGEPDVE